MLQTVTAKLKIVVSDSQKQILLDTMKAYSNACNMVSEFVFEHHDLKRYRIHEELYPLIRERYQLKSQMAESCIRTVVARSLRIRRNGSNRTFSVLSWIWSGTAIIP